MSEPTGPVKVSAMGSTRARRKLLTTEEAELFELTQAAGIVIDPEVFKILLDLLRMNVPPTAVFQMLKAMCAGQRLPAEGAPEPARGRTRTGPTTTGHPTLADHRSREGSSQRVPRQPSASRLQKPGKNT